MVEGLAGLSERLGALLGKGKGQPEEAPAAADMKSEVPRAPTVAGKTGTVAGDVQKGMGQLVEGLDASFEDKVREYAGRIAAGEDSKTMGVPGPLQARVSELVVQNRVAAPEPQAGVAAPGSVIQEVPAPDAEIPDWLKSLRGGTESSAGEPAAPSDLPEWLRAPEPPLPMAPMPEPETPPEKTPAAPVPRVPETEEERVARLDKQVIIRSIDKDGNLPMVINGQGYSFGSPDRTLELLRKYRGFSMNEREYGELTDENLDHAIAKIEAMAAAKEAEATRLAAAVEKKAEVSGLTEEEAAKVWETQFTQLENKATDELRRIIAVDEKKLTADGRIKNFGSFVDKRAVMPADEYIKRLKQILAKKEAEAAKGAEPLQPMPASFAVRVEVARGTVARAAKNVGLLPGRIAREKQRVVKSTAELATQLRQNEVNYEVLPDGTRRELRSGIKFDELLPEEVRALEKTRKIMEQNGWSTEDLDEVIAIQRQYQEGREMVAEANKKYGAELAAATKELTPGWFEREPAVVKEMAELQTFFDGIGSPAETERELAEARETERMVNNNFKKLKLTDTQKRLAKEDVTALESQLAVLKNLDVNGLLARKDLPPQLRAVIEARRAGREFNFGTGPVAEFRRRVYESIVGTLGIEATPAVATVEAVAPAMAPAPEPEPAPAPAAAAAPVMSEPKPAAASEKKVEPTAEPVAERMKRPLSTFAKDLIAARQVKDEKERNRAFARATGEAQERLVRGFTDNPQGLRDELAGLPENEQKQLLAILFGAVKSGKADARLDKFARGLLGKKETLGVEVSAGALGIFGKIIEWITGMTVEQLQEQLKAK